MNENRIIAIAAFFKRNVPVFRNCDRSLILGWLNWHAANRSLAYVEKDHRIVAAGTARAVNQDIINLMGSDINIVSNIAKYMTDETGGIVYAEHAASTVKGGLASILVAMRNRFPNAKEFIFSRKNRLYKMKSYNCEQFVTRALSSVAHGKRVL